MTMKQKTEEHHKPTVALEYGKSYLTRDGRLVGPMHVRTDLAYPFGAAVPPHPTDPTRGGMPRATGWAATGAYLRDGVSDLDLVAEYVAEPEPVSDDYAELSRVYSDAFRQASEGKGVERHANGNAFEDQPIITIPEMLGSMEGQAYQVIKKMQEANSMAKRGEHKRAIHEIYGVMNYAAAAILHIEKKSQNDA